MRTGRAPSITACQTCIRFNPHAGSYLAFLGRICPEKRPDHAIEIAKRVGMPLRIAAKVDPVDRDYFETQIEPLLDHPLVEYVGEISDAEKRDFLGDAAAVLCTYDWPEPFGIVLIEALACGTPVLAYRRGSIPEIIEDGVTGFICDSLSDMVAAITVCRRFNGGGAGIPLKPASPSSAWRKTISHCMNRWPQWLLDPGRPSTVGPCA